MTTSSLLQPDRRAFATWTIALVIGIVFVLQLTFDATAQTSSLVRMGALVASRVQAGEIWRLVSCTFLHGGAMHFGFNLLVLLSIGWQLEKIIGSSRFVLVYVVSALGGSLASMMLTKAASVGASGALWGLMAAQFVIAWRSKDVLPQPLQEAMLRSAQQNLVLNVINSFRPGVDWAAHLGGGAAGAALMFAMVASLPRITPPEGQAPTTPVPAALPPIWVRSLAAVGALAMLAGLVFGLVQSEFWQAGGPPRYRRVDIPGAGLTAEVPAQLRLKKSTLDNSMKLDVVYGDLLEDPVLLEILVQPFLVPAADLDAAYTGLRAGMDKAPLPNGGTSAGAAIERTLSGRRVIEKRFNFNNGVVLTRLLEVTPTALRDVELVSRSGMAPEWGAVGERVLLSMEPRKDYAGAIADFDRVVALNPKDALAFSSRGNAKLAKQDYTGAMADFDQVIVLNPKDVSAVINRANAKIGKSDFDAAITDCDRAISMNSNYPLAFVVRGRAKLGKQDYPGAIADFDRAIALNPKDVFAFNLRESAKLAQQDYSGAVADFDQANALNPADVPAVISRANAKLAKGDCDGVITDLDRVIARYPKHSGAFFFRGQGRLKKHDYVGAIGDFGRTIDLIPNQGQVHLFRANARNAIGDFSGALGDYEKEIALQPKNAEHARFYRNILLRQLGRAEEDDLAKQVPDWKEGWLKTMGSFLVGQLPAEDFIRGAAAENNATTSRRHLCEAHYFVGMAELIAGRAEAARQNLISCVTTREHMFFEFMLAEAALARLGVYVVQEGDTGIAIAGKNGVPLTKLSDLNREVDWASLQPGQLINLPLND